MIMLIGSNGLLGRSLKNYFENELNENVIKLSSHTENGEIYFNLMDTINCMNIKRIASNIKYAIICSSITNIDYCFKNIEQSRFFNVEQTIKLLDTLFELGIVPIYCSSDAVFDGEFGNYKEEDIRNPINEYGRQKKIVEDYIISKSNESLIIRMSKLYSTCEYDTSPITQIIKKLRNNEIVDGAYDQVISLTNVTDIAQIIYLLMKNNEQGIWNISNVDKYTRYSISKEIGKRLNKENLIKRCSINDFNFVEKRSKDSSLNINKFLHKYDYKFRVFEQDLDWMVGNKNE